MNKPPPGVWTRFGNMFHLCRDLVPVCSRKVSAFPAQSRLRFFVPAGCLTPKSRSTKNCNSRPTIDCLGAVHSHFSRSGFHTTAFIADSSNRLISGDRTLRIFILYPVTIHSTVKRARGPQSPARVLERGELRK
jgi:hypothetical protein